MNEATDRPIQPPITLFLLHFLGGSGRTWSPVVTHLSSPGHVPGFTCIAIDLAGFGDAAAMPGYELTAMVDTVIAQIAQAAPTRWALIGHSMGAKVALAIASRAEAGAAHLAGLVALVTIAGSPPGPEPMEADQRRTMLGWFAGDAASSTSQATTYIDQNCSIELPDEIRRNAIVDVLRTNRAAWLAWLNTGSREDWAEPIGILTTPTLILAGGQDHDLGHDAQLRLTAPHLAGYRIVTLEPAGHLLPLEMPEAVAALIATHVTQAATLADANPKIGQAYQRLILSGRVSTNTRATLLARLAPAAPTTLDTPHLVTLRAVLDRVIPQTAPAPALASASAPASVIDLAPPIDAALGTGNGWRFANLPPDPAAYRLALEALDTAAQLQHHRPFHTLPPPDQDALLQAIADATLAAGQLDPQQLQHWFEDLRSDAVQAYMAHPATLARIGYSGIGYGGDGTPKPGFHPIGLGARQDWEPEAYP